jgi:hypothetical protein
LSCAWAWTICARVWATSPDCITIFCSASSKRA